jgi:hypothetical protein
MTPASYTISGTGPNSATFTQTITGTSTTVASLAFGSWTITVNAYNSDTTPTLIGSGSTTATVNTGETTTVAITVTPLTGTGALDLTVNWTASQVQSPSISASLTPFSGTETLNSFTLGSGTATSNTTGLATGYSTLALSLKDNNVAEMGAVEVVRIVKGQTTSGAYTLDVNQAGGSILVNITPNMENPLAVAIAGAGSSTVAHGTTETLTASVTGYSGNVTYVWYVNGQSVGTGSTYPLNVVSSNPNANGQTYTYRIDVTAFSSDGSQAGSATATQTVTFS